MMLIGFEGTCRTLVRGTPSEKSYLAVLDGNGTVFYFHGNIANPYAQGGRYPFSTIHDAVTKLRELHAEKVDQKGYTIHTVALVPSVNTNTREDVLRAWQATGSRIDMHGMLEPAIAQFRAASPTTPAPAPTVAASTVRVQDRGPRLLPAKDQTFTRPNGDVYLPRDLAGNADVLTLQAFRAQPRPIHCLLSGPAGSGKTALAEAAHGDEIVTLNCHGDMTVANMVGQLVPDMKGGWRVTPGPLTIAMENGWALLVDEINALPKECATFLHAAGDGRGVVRFDDRADDPFVYAKPGFCMVGTLNPDAMGSKGLTEAITSRFTVQIEVVTDHAAALSTGVSKQFVSVAANIRRKNAENPQAQPIWEPQMRELQAAQGLVDAGFSMLMAAQSMLSQCPYPEDVPRIAEIMGVVFGQPVAVLKLGEQL